MSKNKIVITCLLSILLVPAQGKTPVHQEKQPSQVELSQWAQKKVAGCKKYNYDLVELNKCYLELSPQVGNLYRTEKYREAFALASAIGANDPMGYSEYLLGSMYMNGKGATKDLDLAIMWYGQAIVNVVAVQHDSACQPNCKKAAKELEALYLNDLGVAYERMVNYENAFNSYKQAAEFGSAQAQFNLARMYSAGHGTIQDNKEAYAWVSAAVAKGLPSIQQQKMAENLKSTLATQFWIILGSNWQKAINEADALAKQYYNQYDLGQDQPAVRSQ